MECHATIKDSEVIAVYENKIDAIKSVVEYICIDVGDSTVQCSQYPCDKELLVKDKYICSHCGLNKKEIAEFQHCDGFSVCPEVIYNELLINGSINSKNDELYSIHSVKFITDKK